MDLFENSSPQKTREMYVDDLGGLELNCAFVKNKSLPISVNAITQQVEQGTKILIVIFL